MPDKLTASTVGLALLAASEVPNFLAGLLPSVMTIRRFAAEDVDREALRQGELIGSALALAVGYGATLVADSVLPVAVTIVILAVMLAMYEYAIRHPHSDAVPIDQQPGRQAAGGPYGY